MAYENINITIDKDGTVQMEYKGRLGKACEDATKQVEQLLGSVTEREHTSDYYKRDPDRKNWLSRGN